MIRNETSFPWRVMAIASVLFATVVVLGWLVFGRSDISPDPGTAANTPPSPLQEPRSATQPAATDPGEAQNDPDALDPTSPDALAALPAARAQAGTMDLQLFLVVPGIERLIGVPQTVSAPATLDAQVRVALDQLIGWTGSETISPVPPETTVREVWVSGDRIAYIDFDRSFEDFAGGGSLGELQAVYGIVATLTQSFPEISAVQFLVEGNQIETLSGHVDLSRPLPLSEDWVLIERRGPSEQQPPDSGNPRALETGA